MRKLISSLAILAVFTGFGACGSTATNYDLGDDAGGSSSGGSGGGGLCSHCSTTQDCSSGQVCAKFPAGNYCIANCGNGQSCSGGSTCQSGGDYAGNPVQGCVPADLCAGGSNSSSGGSSGGNSGGSSGGGSGGGSSGGCTTNTGPISGTVGANGGSLSRLVFAVAGDTRPANEDDTGGYPSAIISKIYQDIEAQSPHPPFTLGTGDYQFSSTGSYATADQMVSMYMQARQSYTGAFFPAMGNHECGVGYGCSGSTDCNCGPSNSGGATPNYKAFMSQMLGPIQQQNPYYAINVNAMDNSWTAKFVITAANAWDSNQQTWLQNTLAQKTTYTFVVRHEPSDAMPPLPPGVAGVDAVLAQNPYTLLIAGHSHTYGHWNTAPQVVVIGNGGAPLSSKNYGYGLFSQRCDGAIVVDEYDYMSGATDSYFHFVVKPNGQITQ